MLAGRTGASTYSNVVCTTPDNQAQAGVDNITTGYSTGKGKNRSFVPGDVFSPGDSVTLRRRAEGQGHATWPFREDRLPGD